MLPLGAAVVREHGRVVRQGTAARHKVVGRIPSLVQVFQAVLVPAEVRLDAVLPQERLQVLTATHQWSALQAHWADPWRRRA